MPHLPALLGAAFLALAISSDAETAGEASGMRLDAWDFAWGGVGLAAQMGAQLRYRGMDPADTAGLDRRELWLIDRWAAGMYAPWADLGSDFLVVPMCALPVVLSAWDARAAGFGSEIRAAAVDAVILGEALLLASSLNLAVRSLRIHPRPYVYGRRASPEMRLEGQASGSFYSGHASSAFLAATYFAYTYPLRHPGFTASGPLWAGSMGLAAGVAGLRVAAGRHFPSDIIAGAALGSFFGWFVPWMHLSRPGNGRARIDADVGPWGGRFALAWSW